MAAEKPISVHILYEPPIWFVRCLRKTFDVPVKVKKLWVYLYDKPSEYRDRRAYMDGSQFMEVWYEKKGKKK